MGRKYGGRRAAAFIFDLDGTLVDSGHDIAVAANFVRGHYELPQLPLETLVSFVGDGVRVLMQRTLSDGGLPVPDDEKVAEALGVFRDHYGRHCLDNTKAYPGVLQMLAHFHRFPLMVATNKPRRYTEQILAGVHLDGAFRRVVAGDDVERLKPDPMALQLCLEGVEVDPADVVVVGDSPNDIAAARALGAVSVGVTYGLVARGLVESAGPDHVIDTITGLTQLFPSR